MTPGVISLGRRMFDIDDDDLECEDMLEQTGDALNTLPQGHKPATAMVDVQFNVPSDDGKTNSDIISILFDIYRCFSQIMSQNSPLKPRDWKLKVW